MRKKNIRRIVALEKKIVELKFALVDAITVFDIGENTAYGKQYKELIDESFKTARCIRAVREITEEFGKKYDSN